MARHIVYNVAQHEGQGVNTNEQRADQIDKSVNDPNHFDADKAQGLDRDHFTKDPGNLVKDGAEAEKEYLEHKGDGVWDKIGDGYKKFIK